MKNLISTKIQMVKFSEIINTIVFEIKKYIDSKSGFTDAKSETTMLSKHLNVWQDNKSGLKIDIFIPARLEDNDKLFELLKAHEAMQFGQTECWKPYIAVLKNNSGKQICGAIGSIHGKTLFLDALAMPIMDIIIFQKFMKTLERFASQNCVTVIFLRLSDKEIDLIKNLNICEYTENGRLTDLLNGGYICFLSKQIKIIPSIKINKSFNKSFAFQWVDVSDYHKKRDLIKASPFFSPQMQACMRELTPLFKPTVEIGVIIQDKNGLLMGGAVGAYFLDAITPHEWLKCIWIDPVLRNKGFARIIISIIEEIAKKLDCKYAAARTTTIFAPGLYKKLDYQIEYESLTSNQKSDQVDNKVYFFYKKL